MRINKYGSYFPVMMSILMELIINIAMFLAVYLTAEYLFVILLLVQSVIYLKRKHY